MSELNLREIRTNSPAKEEEEGHDVVNESPKSRRRETSGGGGVGTSAAPSFLTAGLSEKSIQHKSMNISILEEAENLRRRREGDNDAKKQAKAAILSSMLAHSQKLLGNEDEGDAGLQQTMRMIEERAYVGATRGPIPYLSKLCEQLKANHPFMPASVEQVTNMNEEFVNKFLDGTVQIEKRRAILSKHQINNLNMSVDEGSYHHHNQTKRRFVNPSHKSQMFLNSSVSIDKSALGRSAAEMTVDNVMEQSQTSIDPRQQLVRFIKLQEEIKRNQEERRQKDLLKQVEREARALEEREMQKKSHLEEVAKRVQESSEHRANHKETLKKNNEHFAEFYKVYKEKKPLFKILEEDSSHFQQQEIKLQQERLQKLREVYKPHKFEDFDDHFKKYSEFQLQEEKRIQHKKEEYNSLATKNTQSNASLWRGRAHEIVEEEQRNLHMHSASDYRRARQEKQKSYAELVKSNHLPRVDPEKVKQSAERISLIVAPRNLIKKMLLNKEIVEEPNQYKIGLENMEIAKKFAKEHRRMSRPNVSSAETLTRRAHYTNVGVESSPITLAPAKATANTTTIQYKNYMREARFKSMLKKEEPMNDWETQLARLSPTERFEKAIIAAQHLDTQAQRKEKLLKYAKNAPSNRNASGTDLDDLYCHSIKAKIAILKQASEFK